MLSGNEISKFFLTTFNRAALDRWNLNARRRALFSVVLYKQTTVQAVKVCS